MALTLPNALVVGANEDVSKVQGNFDEIANAFPVQAANIGDSQVTTAKLASGAVTPRKQSTIYHASGATGAGFTPFSGLNGDAAYAYDISGFLYTTSAATSTDNPMWRINGLSTNYIQFVNHQHYYNTGAPTQNVTAGATPTGVIVGSQIGGGSIVHRISFQTRIHSKTGQGRRFCDARSFYDTGTSTQFPMQDHSSTIWNETTTNITSLQFVWAGIGAVLSGWIRLDALAEV